VSTWSSTKARRVYAALARLGWTLKKQVGSHRKLQRPGWRDFTFCFHDNEEVGPARGGHFIPDADVRRRYARSVANAALALRLADTAKFYDNSGDDARLILVANAGVVVWRSEAVPEWVRL
jgi:predicted RNA binding protein YcfA (HicA-like mRNA interferase family)